MLDGWIEWDGGEQPVADGVLLDIIDRDGFRWVNSPARQHYWSRGGSGTKPDNDIVAYRLASPQGAA